MKIQPNSITMYLTMQVNNNNNIIDSSKCFSLIEVKMDDPIEKIKEQLID